MLTVEDFFNEIGETVPQRVDIVLKATDAEVFAIFTKATHRTYWRCGFSEGRDNEGWDPAVWEVVDYFVSK